MNHRLSALLSAATAVAMTVALLPRDASADCISVYDCLCIPVSTLVDGHVLRADAQGLVVQVDRVRGDDAQIHPGDTVVATHGVALEPGTRVLAWFDSGQSVRTVPVDAQGQVTCEYADPDFVLPADEAASLALENDCAQRLRDRGLQQPPCNDTVTNTAPLPGCSASPGALPVGAWVTVLLAVAAGAAARGSRRRARK